MLTDIAVKNARPKEKPYKITDADNLYLMVTPSGGKLWRFDYRFMGKRKTLSFGAYPDVSLVKAREGRDKARRLIADGEDPSAVKKTKNLNTFESVARSWFEMKKSGWADSHSETVIQRFENHVFPFIGNRPISDITHQELLSVIRRLESKGINETAHRVNQICGQVFRYGIILHICDRNPADDLRGALAPVQHKHFPTITEPKEIGALLRAVDGFKGGYYTRSALKFSALVFVRPGELRRAEWSEIDFNQAEWRIPAHKMKMKRVHIVPLSRQALDVLKEIHPLTGHGRWVFPSLRSSDRPMSENTVSAALRRLGYSGDEMVAHSFKSMASTRLNEMGYNRDVIERQLAHAERNKVRSAYNHAEYLPERKKMMQDWADYLDGLRG